MKDLAKIMQQAQQMQAKMQEAQAKIESTEADGVSGAGLVKVRLRGKGELVSLSIDPSLMGDEPEIIEDLIKAAHNDAKRKADKLKRGAAKQVYFKVVKELEEHDAILSVQLFSSTSKDGVEACRQSIIAFCQSRLIAPE